MTLTGQDEEYISQLIDSAIAENIVKTEEEAQVAGTSIFQESTGSGGSSNQVFIQHSFGIEDPFCIKPTFSSTPNCDEDVDQNRFTQTNEKLSRNPRQFQNFSTERKNSISTSKHDKKVDTELTKALEAYRIEARKLERKVSENQYFQLFMVMENTKDTSNISPSLWNPFFDTKKSSKGSKPSSYSSVESDDIKEAIDSIDELNRSGGNRSTMTTAVAATEWHSDESSKNVYGDTEIPPDLEKMETSLDVGYETDAGIDNQTNQILICVHCACACNSEFALDKHVENDHEEVQEVDRNIHRHENEYLKFSEEFVRAQKERREKQLACLTNLQNAEMDSQGIEAVTTQSGEPTEDGSYTNTVQKRQTRRTRPSSSKKRRRGTKRHSEVSNCGGNSDKVLKKVKTRHGEHEDDQRDASEDEDDLILVEPKIDLVVIESDDDDVKSPKKMSPVKTDSGHGSKNPVINERPIAEREADADMKKQYGLKNVSISLDRVEPKDFNIKLKTPLKSRISESRLSRHNLPDKSSPTKGNTSSQTQTHGKKMHPYVHTSGCSEYPPIKIPGRNLRKHKLSTDDNSAYSSPAESMSPNYQDHMKKYGMKDTSVNIRKESQQTPKKLLRSQRKTIASPPSHNVDNQRYKKTEAQGREESIKTKSKDIDVTSVGLLRTTRSGVLRSHTKEQSPPCVETGKITSQEESRDHEPFKKKMNTKNMSVRAQKSKSAVNRKQSIAQTVVESKKDIDTPWTPKKDIPDKSPPTKGNTSSVSQTITQGKIMHPYVSSGGCSEYPMIKISRTSETSTAVLSSCKKGSSPTKDDNNLDQLKKFGIKDVAVNLSRSKIKSECMDSLPLNMTVTRTGGKVSHTVNTEDMLKFHIKELSVSLSKSDDLNTCKSFKIPPKAPIIKSTIRTSTGKNTKSVDADEIKRHHAVRNLSKPLDSTGEVRKSPRKAAETNSNLDITKKFGIRDVSICLSKTPLNSLNLNKHLTKSTMHSDSKWLSKNEVLDMNLVGDRPASETSDFSSRFDDVLSTVSGRSFSSTKPDDQISLISNRSVSPQPSTSSGYIYVPRKRTARKSVKDEALRQQYSVKESRVVVENLSGIEISMLKNPHSPYGKTNWLNFVVDSDSDDVVSVLSLMDDFHDDPEEVIPNDNEDPPKKRSKGKGPSKGSKSGGSGKVKSSGTKSVETITQISSETQSKEKTITKISAETSKGKTITKTSTETFGKTRTGTIKSSEPKSCADNTKEPSVYSRAASDANLLKRFGITSSVVILQPANPSERKLDDMAAHTPKKNPGRNDQSIKKKPFVADIQSEHGKVDWNIGKVANSSKTTHELPEVRVTRTRKGRKGMIEMDSNSGNQRISRSSKRRKVTETTEKMDINSTDTSPKKTVTVSGENEEGNDTVGDATTDSMVSKSNDQKDSVGHVDNNTEVQDARGSKTKHITVSDKDEVALPDHGLVTTDADDVKIGLSVESTTSADHDRENGTSSHREMCEPGEENSNTGSVTDVCESNSGEINSSTDISIDRKTGEYEDCDKNKCDEISNYSHEVEDTAHGNVQSSTSNDGKDESIKGGTDIGITDGVPDSADHTNKVCSSGFKANDGEQFSTSIGDGGTKECSSVCEPVDTCSSVQLSMSNDGAGSVSVSDGVQLGMSNDGAGSVSVNDGVQIGIFNDGPGSVSVSDGVQLGVFNDGAGSVSLNDGVQIGVFNDGASSVSLNNDVQLGLFNDEAGSVSLNDGVQLGLFNDGAGSVSVNDGVQIDVFNEGAGSVSMNDVHTVLDGTEVINRSVENSCTNNDALLSRSDDLDASVSVEHLSSAFGYTDDDRTDYDASIFSGQCERGNRTDDTVLSGPCEGEDTTSAQEIGVFIDGKSIVTEDCGDTSKGEISASNDKDDDGSKDSESSNDRKYTKTGCRTGNRDIDLDKITPCDEKDNVDSSSSDKSGQTSEINESGCDLLRVPDTAGYQDLADRDTVMPINSLHIVDGVDHSVIGDVVIHKSE